MQADSLVASAGSLEGREAAVVGSSSASNSTSMARSVCLLIVRLT
jgi:hypothetical protein